MENFLKGKFILSMDELCWVIFIMAQQNITSDLKQLVLWVSSSIVLDLKLMFQHCHVMQ